MAKPDHIILCGGAPAPRGVSPDQIVRLDLGGDEPTVDLEIADISRRLSSDVPDVLTDLIEIASYVYCADQAVTRGGQGVLAFGAHWRRNFIFHIPVRLPSMWSSPNVLDVLQKTLGILSEDTYEFHFARRIKAVPMQQYLKLGDGDSSTEELDEVLLFSGGVDSLGGAVQEAVLDKRRVALVSHRSNSKVFSRQKQLIGGLLAICQPNPPVHVPVWVHQSGSDGREYTQRSRTFLYASLAAAVAHVFGLKHIRFYENGVVSLNLPISEQVVGARATRTTHPQVLDGFARLFSNLVEQPFTVENPFLWVTKTEVVNLIGDAGCGHLIEQSVSCMHTHEQTKEKPHCGRCSQCISRRFATLASRYPLSDPDTIYKADLLTAERSKGEHPKTGDLTLVESFIRTATDIGSMNDFQIVEHYGEISRVLRHVRPLSADQVAEKVILLYRRHSTDVTKVMDDAIRAHASDIREGKLPPTCAILLAIPESYKRVGTEPSETERGQSGGAGRPVTHPQPQEIVDFSSDSWRKHNRRNADLEAWYARHLGRNNPEFERQEKLLKDARDWAEAALREIVPDVQDVLELKQRVVKQTWDKFVPTHRYHSDFQLGYREFTSALWEEGSPSLEDRAALAIQEGAASAVGQAGAVTPDSPEERRAANSLKGIAEETMNAPELSAEAKDRIRRAVMRAESALSDDLELIPRPHPQSVVRLEPLLPAFQSLAKAIYDAYAREYSPKAFTSKNYVGYFMATLLASINDQILEAHGLWDKWAPHVFQSLASGNPLRMKQFRKELFNAMLDRYHYWKVEHQKSADELSSYNLKVDADQREAKLPDGSEKAGSPRAAEGIGGQRQRAAKWEDIEICFLSEYRVQIRNGTNTESGNYDELGFADRRAKRGDPKPNQAWVTLRAMAEQNGIIQDGTKMGATWPKVEKRIQEIRKVLRKHFSITADPIPFVKGIGYQAVFKISCSPAYAT